MNLDRLDHVAIEVGDLDAHVAKLCGTGGLRVLRRGTVASTGARMAMLGDRVGMKIELIERGAATDTRFLHVAFRTTDVEAVVQEAAASDWQVARGPAAIAAAHAQSAFLCDAQGFEFQIIAYAPDSPDIVEW